MNIIVSIQLDKKSNVPLYIQLKNQLKKLIRDGKLTGDSKLPPIRKLARELEVNNVTVVNAYKQLENEKYVYSKVGSGTYVKKQDEYYLENTTESNKDIRLMSTGHVSLSEDSINFASADPTPDLFPVKDFKQVLNEVLDRDKGEAFGYQESNGYGKLRSTISKFMTENYFTFVHEDNVQIISGAQQGIDIVAKALIKPGDCVFVENPTYGGATAAFKSRGAKVIGIPIMKDGIDIKVLNECMKIYRPKLLYTMTNYQNPTTISYTNEKKKVLLELALKNNFYIIEDDFCSDLNFLLDKKNTTLKTFDKEDRVLYIKSFSKVLMPGLRIGFLVVPSKIFKYILQAKHTTDISSSGLIQRAFELYLSRGMWDKNLNYMKKIYNKRYNKMLQWIDKMRKLGVRCCRPNGGLNLWITLPEGISSKQLYEKCAKYNVIIVPGEIFYIDKLKSYRQNVRLSFAAVHLNEIEKGMKIIYENLQQLVDKNKVYYSPLI